MATTGHGPAWMTVTGVTPPVSSSKTWVIPSFLPTIPFIRSQLDLDVDPGGQVEPHQRVDRLRGRAVDVDQPLVRPDLEVLPRVLVLERASNDRVDVLLGRQRDRPRDGRARALGGLDDRLRRLVELRVVVALESDSDLGLRHRRVPSTSVFCSCSNGPKRVTRGRGPYLTTSVTTPAPTVLPPSRTAKRRPASIAIGWISSICMLVLSPGMTISCPSGSPIAPVTSVVRK